MRLEVTRKADLAVRALALLASTDRLKSGELAEALCTTTGFVPQVIGPLVKAGWVRSEPGPTGGYLLTVPAVELSVLQVIEVIDGPTDNGQCVVADKQCLNGGPCTVHDAWARARRELMTVLAARKVADIPLGVTP